MAGKKNAKGLWILQASADRLALLAAAGLSLIVMIASAWNGVQVGPFLVRACSAFAFGYVAIHLLVFLVQRTAKTELEMKKQAELDRKKAEIQAKAKGE
jgi:hypothetical protein